MKILLIDDDSSLAKAIELAVANEGIVLDYAATGAEGENFATAYDYDLIILDLLLPDSDGLELLKTLRNTKLNVPVIILSGINEANKKIEGLGYGADDYLTKPFDIEELIARIKAVVRRTEGHSENMIMIGDLSIDFNRHITTIGGEAVNLTSKEQDLLELMALKKGNTINKENFIEHLYKGLDEPDLKVIDVFICKMRKKLKVASGGKNYISTVWGRGYILQDPEANSG